MKFSTKAIAPDKARAPLAVFGVFEGRKPTAALQALDKAADGAIGRLLERGDIEGKPGSTRLAYDVGGFERVLLVGLGKAASFGAKEYRDAVGAATRAIVDTGARRASFFLLDIAAGKRGMRWKARHAAMAAADALYRFDAMKSKKNDARALEEIELVTAQKALLKDAERGAAEGAAIGAAMDFAKDLGNLPGNVCTPTYLAEQARHMAAELKLEVEILERETMAELGMNTLLSVAAGSAQPPKLIILKYHGAGKKAKPVCLVGKGITFDTGGISLKPGEAMDEMKFDMSGAGSVLAAVRAAAAMKLKLNVYGIVAAVENMPGGKATKPGDIVTSLSGQTVEILNTDAEGRLVLCDALTYIERFEPDAVVDAATLTGACVIALGHHVSGLFANNDALSRELVAAGEEACDRAWPLPLFEEYQEQLKSNFADFANIGGRPAGAVTAACFLARFAKKYRWAHLDIAGTAWKSGAAKGSTARPVPLLTQFLLARAGR